MPKRIGNNTIKLESSPAILGFASVCGKKESEGPLAKFFDKTFQDTKLGQDSWEKAESRLQTEAVNIALKKAKISAQEIDYIFAGDLLNQSISSTFGLRNLNIPFIGQYGACSTMAQTIAMASFLVDGGIAQKCVAVTSSHFCSAERQFRLPLEYGGQRTPAAQWTVTGSGALVVGKSSEGPFIKHATIGKITDFGIKDASNMGAAMAPAAARTIADFFYDTNTSAENYDLILTGDLGKVGSALLQELLLKYGVKFCGNYNDCGLLMYDINKQDVHAGGSGCGCSGAVLCSLILKNLISGKIKNLLFVATGALMSTTSFQQGESIPSIAHLVEISDSKF